MVCGVALVGWKDYPLIHFVNIALLRCSLKLFWISETKYFHISVYMNRCANMHMCMRIGAYLYMSIGKY